MFYSYVQLYFYTLDIRYGWPLPIERMKLRMLKHVRFYIFMHECTYNKLP